jgi:hypothetical protein
VPYVHRLERNKPKSVLLQKQLDSNLPKPNPAMQTSQPVNGTAGIMFSTNVRTREVVTERGLLTLYWYKLTVTPRHNPVAKTSGYPALVFCLSPCKINMGDTLNTVQLSFADPWAQRRPIICLANHQYSKPRWDSRITTGAASCWSAGSLESPWIGIWSQ